ncbi:ABC-2 transporter permease [Vaginisenegalia massiliensis]|uniref:ABC-2 transporter permease n=1 Tax=Vaginisenegalia massiliensis TaxID=2058294 RepID=UPI000F530D38|nr:ABC-2 transporter permease [Vaginisenegalia massiliensis]
MQKILKFDLLAMRPYFTWKNLFILVALCVFYSYFTKNLLVNFMVAQMFAIIFASYPFLVGDQVGLDSLFRITGIKPDTVVYGRYLTGLLICLFSVLVGYLMSIIMAYLTGFSFDMDQLGPLFITYVLFTSLVIGFQYPIYFKYGYLKAKMVMMSFFLILGLLAFLVSHFKEEVMVMGTWLIHHSVLMVMIGISLLFLIFLGSITLSRNIYRHKDFA